MPVFVLLELEHVEQNADYASAGRRIRMIPRTRANLHIDPSAAKRHATSHEGQKRVRDARGWASAAIGAAAALVLLGSSLSSAEQQKSNQPQLICRMVDTAAESYRVPASFLTRVLWQESGFRTNLTSPAGAAGVAQFMPETAAERGLEDPYDPYLAIPQAARFLAELLVRFRNLGLAAAAYNAGAAGVTKWLRGEANLPTETRLFVLAVTGHDAEEWRTGLRDIPADGERQNCIGITAGLSRQKPALAFSHSASTRMEVWQVRLDEFLAKAVRLKSQRPGTVPISSSNRAAESLCERIRAMGAPCAVYER